MTKSVNITIDIAIARDMLGLAGFNMRNATDDEVFEKVLTLIDCYGATCEIRQEEKNTAKETPKIDLTNFVLAGNNREEAYNAHISFEMSFSNPDVRDIVSFEEFCRELVLGYGQSDHTQIARLYEAPDGKIYYDNDYCV